MSAALAPFAAPSVAPSAPASAPASAPIASSPMAPYGATSQPFGSPPPPVRALADEDDPYAPLAPLAVPVTGEFPGDGGGVETLPGGPNRAIQINEGEKFVGYSNLLYDDANKAILLDGNFYLTSPSGGAVSALNNVLTISGANGLNLVSYSNMILQTAGQIQMQLPSAGVLQWFGVSWRQSACTFNSTSLSMYGGTLGISNFAGDATYLVVNTNPGPNSPIGMPTLPTAPTARLGDVYRDSSGFLRVVIPSDLAVADEPQAEPETHRRSNVKRKGKSALRTARAWAVLPWRAIKGFIEYAQSLW